MWRDIRDIYASAIAFSRAAPLLFLIPVLAEAAQHVVEWRIGMYDGWDGARASSEAMSRMGWGLLKTLALLLPGYWFMRYMAWRDPARAGRWESPAAALFGVQFVIKGAVQALTLFGPGLAVIGLTGTPATAGLIALFLFQTVIGVYLTAWLVAWPLGNAAIGPLRSFGVMAGSFWRAVGYLLAGVLPLMLLHYALGLGAIGRPRGLVWTMLALDSVVVGYLALTMTGAIFVAARHAAARKGVALTP